MLIACQDELRATRRRLDAAQSNFGKVLENMENLAEERDRLFIALDTEKNKRNDSERSLQIAKRQITRLRGSLSRKKGRFVR